MDENGITRWNKIVSGTLERPRPSIPDLEWNLFFFTRLDFEL